MPAETGGMVNRRVRIHIVLTLEAKTSKNLDYVPTAQVKSDKLVSSTGEGGATTYSYTYQGTFVTRDGTIFVVPPAVPREYGAPETGREIEKRMLSVLFSKNLNPGGGRGGGGGTPAADWCQARNGPKLDIFSTVRAVATHPVRGTAETRSCTEHDAADPRYDCLLLVRGGDGGGDPGQAASTGMVRSGWVFVRDGIERTEK